MFAQRLDPHTREKTINQMGLGNKSPEEIEEYAKLKAKFDSEIRHTLEKIGENTFPGITGKIAGNYELNGGNLEIAIQTEISKLSLPEAEKKELTKHILKLTNRETTKPDDVRASGVSDNETQIGERNATKSEKPVTAEKELSGERPDDSTYAVVIENFKKQGKLNGHETKTVKTALIGVKENFGAALKDTDIDTIKKTAIIKSLEFLIRPESKTKNQDHFSQDFSSQIEGLKEENGKEKKLSEKNSDLTQLIGGNYLIQDLSGKENGKIDSSKEKSLDVAFKISGNSLIDGRHDIKRDETFLKTLSTLRRKDLPFKERYQALSQLYDIVNTSEGMKGKSQEKSNTVGKQEIKTFQESFKATQKLLIKAEQNGNKHAQEKQLIAMEAKRTEMAENSIEGGEIMQGGKGDTLLQEGKLSLKTI